MFAIDKLVIFVSTLKENHICSTTNICANVFCMMNYFNINLQDYWTKTNLISVCDK